MNFFPLGACKGRSTLLYISRKLLELESWNFTNGRTDRIATAIPCIALHGAR